MHRKPNKFVTWIKNIGWKRLSVTAVLIAAISLIMGPSAFASAATTLGYHVVKNRNIDYHAITDSKMNTKSVGFPKLSQYTQDRINHSVKSVTTDADGNLVITLNNGTTQTVDLNNSSTPPPAQTCVLADGIGTSITGAKWQYNVQGKSGDTNDAGKVKVTDKGKVRLKITNATAYQDAGVVVPLGTVKDVFDANGKLNPLTITGPGKDKVAANLWVDNNGSGFGDGNGGDAVYKGDVNDNKDHYWFYSDNPTKTDVGGDAANDDAVWAWVGITVNSGDAQATLNTVDDKHLATC